MAQNHSSLSLNDFWSEFYAKKDFLTNLSPSPPSVVLDPFIEYMYANQVVPRFSISTKICT